MVSSETTRRWFSHPSLTGEFDLAHFVQVTRRPGGQVPVAPGETNEKTAHHFQMMELQAFEESNVPLPLIKGQRQREYESKLSERVQHIAKINAAVKKGNK